jgi:ubiquinone/menaquinone biosynthesis C-methylase UbiE
MMRALVKLKPTRPMPSDGYLRALRFPALTRVYDPIIRLGTRERLFKSRLLEQAPIAAGGRVLDLGCGTGTLAIEAKQREPGAEVAGLDADPEMLEQARAKANDAGVEIQLVQGFSTVLPWEDGSFDVVLSTLFFHHLDGESKHRTAAEIARVLDRKGELHVADFGRPQDPVMAAAITPLRAFDGFANTRDNVRGALPQIFERAGLDDAQRTAQLRTPVGTLALYRARRGR